MSELPILRLRHVADDLDEAFVLSLAPDFTAFELPSWRERRPGAPGAREALRRQLESAGEDGHLLLAEDDQGRRVGFVGLSLSRDYFSGQRQVHLNELAVAKSCRRQGVGTALLRLAEQWARERGGRALTLNVFPGNEAARRLYAGAGYQLDLLRLAKVL